MNEASGKTEELQVEAFVAHWSQSSGAERANFQSFAKDLCKLLDLPEPEPTRGDASLDSYVFEYGVKFKEADGSESPGRIDLYKKGSFVLEAKQSRLEGRPKAIPGQEDLFVSDTQSQGRRSANRGWDVLMMNARRQAEEYAKALPASHGWPPFILVCDVGHCIEVYADFSGQGKNYAQFPDRQGFRIFLEDLRKEDVRKRLKLIWTDPQALDLSRQSAKVTREIAARLAQVSKALEAKGYDAEQVALFLMRCLFTMFAEDVELLPKESFTTLLAKCADDPSKFAPMVEQLWVAMDKGEFAYAIERKVPRFNGRLFADAKALPLGREEIGELVAAAKANWREVEPAIFGTLLEQALDKEERKRLGAHYTPRAYVERLVVATIIEPLRVEWANVQATAERLRKEKRGKDALAVVKAFHDKLCDTRVLDPACGTGNFLYVSMELMKRLEGEVLESLLDLGGQEALSSLERHTVDPHQFLGLELNPRAAAIAELVIWLGYLQWHFRTKGSAPSEPILRDFRNIEVKDAVLTWEGWPVPQIIEGKVTYPKARQPDWPEAEFIIGNPPFIGNKRLKARLGSEYVKALRSAYPAVPGSVDLVMYWWFRCAEFLKRARITRFGLIATNSIVQPLNRPGLAYLSETEPRCSVIFAIPDHPWVDVEKGAQVRVAMLAAKLGVSPGKLVEIQTGRSRRGNAPVTSYRETEGLINVRLTIGADTSKTNPLISNRSVSQQGVILVGEGFRLKPPERRHLIDISPEYQTIIRPYRIGNDLTDVAEERYVIDVNAWSETELRDKYPHAYEILLERVKPERATNNDPAFRDYWWRFGRRRPEIVDLSMGQERYIATCRTARYRFFTFLDSAIVPDAKIIFIGLGDGYSLGVLSSSTHVKWSLAAGAWLGVGNDSNYNHSDCFDPFPFPEVGSEVRAEVCALAEALDRHRKDRQAEHPKLTLTQVYNVLEKLKAGEALSKDEERIKDEGLILILKELHERLDKLVFQAYGWPDDLSDEQILERLVALNQERAAEEKQGKVRWLRPDYQIPRFGSDAEKARLKAEKEKARAAQDALALEAEPVNGKPRYPTDDELAETAAVMSVLAAAPRPLTINEIAASFAQGKRIEKRVALTILALARLGHLASTDRGESFSLRRSA
ncbi:MAG: class I SAM-dependent DNA methyltransferase [Methyloceanibacter sp.]|uniref:class I SAM-dependent DNA methyltransferase n=1 Tax=Methyloceanibacter sp. TaxID=1965321 RepID=UPI003D6D5F64